jgi:predicted RNase H-like HicB family nuclease
VGKAVKATRLDRPFATDVWRKALDVARSYQLIVSFEDGVYLGRTVEMPYAVSDGRTIAECAARTLGATAASIATILESGRRPPTPSRDAVRTQQVNIRLSSDEKLQLEAAAKREGFRSLSDFVRSAALRGAAA